MQSCTLQELRCRIVARSFQLSFSCWPRAGSDLSAKVPCIVRRGECFFTNAQAHISNRRRCHTSSGVCNRTCGENCRPYCNQKRYSTSTNNNSNTHAERFHGLPWPSVFHPLLDGLPLAPPHSERRTHQGGKHEGDSSVALRSRTISAGASCEVPSAKADLLAFPVAVPPVEEKPRVATFYLIHTFHLHPYEAIVFEEALYRFLGQRRKRVYEGSCAAGASQPPGTYSLSTKHPDAVRGTNLFEDILLTLQREDVNVLTGHTRAESRSNVVASQLHEPLSQTHCRQRVPLVQQAATRKNGGQLPTRQVQQARGQKGQLRSESTSSFPSVACAFLHHPPYRPARGNVTWENSSSSSRYTEDSRARQTVSLTGHGECQSPRPSRAVIFGLSGQPAACVRDPESVLQQQTALFIRRFTGGGTVVLGSARECFCVGLLLPHTFSHCRPYPQDLMNLCTSLYLGENIWKKQRCISSVVTAQETPSAATCFATNGADAVPKSTAVVSTDGKCLIREIAAAGLSPFTEPPVPREHPGASAVAASGVLPEVAGIQFGKAGLKQVMWDLPSLYHLSPFAALRWGLLENDYVVTCPSGSLSCAKFSDTALPGASPAVLLKASDHPVGCCPTLAMCAPQIRTRPATTTHNSFHFRIQNSSHTVFKVGGNAQALSRQYGLQHTSFVWDEEQLQLELKDLLLLPKKQPKYRSSRPHVAFLRSVREGLKTHVRVAPLRGMNQEYEKIKETTGNSCRDDMNVLLGHRAATEVGYVRETRPAAAQNHGGTSFAAKGHANSSAQNLFYVRDNASRAAVLERAVGEAGPKRCLSHLDNVASRSGHASEMIQQQTGGVEESACAEENQRPESAGSHVQLNCAAEKQTHFPLDTPSNVLLSLGLLLEGHVSRRNTALHRCSYGREMSIEKLHMSSEIDSTDCCAAVASIEGREKETDGRVKDEEVWECVHCVVAADNKIPVEFKRLWALTDRLADSTSAALPRTETCRARTGRISGSDGGAGPVEDSAGPPKAKGNETGRRLYVLPIEAVRDLVYELFEGSLKDMRSTRLIDARGEKISESVYENIFEINNIIPV